VLPVVDGTESREDVEVVLVEMHAVVVEAGLAFCGLVAAEDAEVVRDPDNPFNGGQRTNGVLVEGFGVADQVDFRQGLLAALDIVNPDLDVVEGCPGSSWFPGKPRCPPRCIRMQNQQHETSLPWQTLSGRLKRPGQV